MRQQQTALTPGDTIQDRYRVERFLGGGGFSTVYLVRDMQAEEGQNALYALKELCNQDEREKIRFLFEGEVLKRLHHSALPSIHRIFDDAELHRVFMLLEYIAGPNLETLRKEQTNKRFSCATMLKLLGPVVEAISYLHEQQPPIIHRDIKPANIIVPTIGEQTVLVDFGIAKEYDAEATTTAVRHCSPGYGAPEQYSGQGTGPSTDIYGLAATCYVLLTGTVPADALHRATSLVSKKIDPLLPANELEPGVPVQVAQTLVRAMSIGQEYRFSTVREFWQELYKAYNAAKSKPLPITDSLALPGTTKRIFVPFFGRKLVSLFLVVLVCALVGLGTWFVASNYPLDAKLHIVATRSSGQANKVLPRTPLLHVPHLVQSYRGTIYDISTNKPTEMVLANIQQYDARTLGNFTGLRITGAFTGVLDQSKHIFFTVAASANHSALFFEGTVRADGSLVGNYCNLDSAGQCTGGYGLWSIAPVHA